jgi:hypothetical protein
VADVKASNHGGDGNIVDGEQHDVMVVRVIFWQCSDFGGVMPRGNPCSIFQDCGGDIHGRLPLHGPPSCSE